MDVVGDGHCGSHVVSKLLGRSIESYSIAYIDLTLKVNNNYEGYIRVISDCMGLKDDSYMPNALTLDGVDQALRVNDWLCQTPHFLLDKIGSMQLFYW